MRSIFHHHIVALLFALSVPLATAQTAPALVDPPDGAVTLLGCPALLWQNAVVRDNVIDSPPGL